MKRAGVIGIVVAVHCVVIGSVVLIQGCGTTPKPVEPATPQVVMPPSLPPVVPPVVIPEKPLPVVPPVAPVSKTYTVKAGDNLSSIAKRLNVTTRDLMRLNSLTNANKIRVGQKLTVPGYTDVNAPAPAHPKKAATAKKGSKGAPVKAGEGEYVVKAGDSLAKIAHKNGTTVAALKQANNLTSDKLKVGQKLTLSGKAAVGEKPAASGEKPALEAPVTPAPVEGAVAPAPVEPKANEVMHVVEPNQDLNSIAMMYGVRVEDMMRLNNLATPDVKVGQTLKIPPPVE